MTVLHRVLLTLFTVVTPLACGSPPPTLSSSCGHALDAGNGTDTNTDRSAVITTLHFERGDPMRLLSSGFDLDGVISTGQDPGSCFRRDFTDPDGRRGIDNQAGTLFRIIDGVTNNALDPLLQGAINNGQVLLGMTFEGLDDPTNDPCVALVFHRLGGMPRVGNDMRIVQNLTFAAVPNETAGRVTGSLRDGVFEAGPFELSLPVAVFDARFTLNVHGTHVRVRLTDESTLEGVIGGGLVGEEIAMVVNGLNVPESTREIASATVRRNTDLAPDSSGDCQQISAAFTFQARPAFINY